MYQPDQTSYEPNQPYPSNQLLYQPNQPAMYQSNQQFNDINLPNFSNQEYVQSGLQQANFNDGFQQNQGLYIPPRQTNAFQPKSDSNIQTRKKRSSDKKKSKGAQRHSRKAVRGSGGKVSTKRSSSASVDSTRFNWKMTTSQRRQSAERSSALRPDVTNLFNYVINIIFIKLGYLSERSLFQKNSRVPWWPLVFIIGISFYFSQDEWTEDLQTLKI